MGTEFPFLFSLCSCTFWLTNVGSHPAHPGTPSATRAWKPGGPDFTVVAGESHAVNHQIAGEQTITYMKYIYIWNIYNYTISSITPPTIMVTWMASNPLSKDDVPWQRLPVARSRHRFSECSILEGVTLRSSSPRFGAKNPLEGQFCCVSDTFLGKRYDERCNSNIYTYSITELANGSKLQVYIICSFCTYRQTWSQWRMLCRWLNPLNTWTGGAVVVHHLQEPLYSSS